MLIIEIAATNGAHRNQAGSFAAIPEGWAGVPAELEAEAMGYLPYINLTISDGAITAVAQGTIPEPDPVPEPEPQPTTEDILNALLGVTE